MNRNLGTNGGAGSTTTVLGQIRLNNRRDSQRRQRNGEAGSGFRRSMNELMALG